MAKKKEVKVVDSKFLRDVANLIHDGHKKTYLRLCTGTLQNGPDPVDCKRTMHCGLGELYFQLTGRQPEEDGVNEDDVVNECLERSALNPDSRAEVLEERIKKTLKKELKDLKLPAYTIDEMVRNALNAASNEIEEDAAEFRQVLNAIPEVNDCTGEETAEDEEGKQLCSMADFKERSRAVAAILREAADLLPE